MAALTRIYVKALLPLIKAGLIFGGAHITGGGLLENPPRAIADGLEAHFDWNAWPLPPVFEWLQTVGGVSDHELRRTFNCGIGFVLIVSPASAEAVLAALLNAGETAFVCGQLAAKDGLMGRRNFPFSPCGRRRGPLRSNGRMRSHGPHNSTLLGRSCSFGRRDPSSSHALRARAPPSPARGRVSAQARRGADFRRRLQRHGPDRGRARRRLSLPKSCW